MRKRILIISGIVIAVAALVAFNKITSKKGVVNAFAEVKNGTFEITVSNTGELIAEKSVDIRGPEIGQSNQQQGGNRGGGSQGGGRGIMGGDMHAMELKIQDIVPEGTLVNEGDYIAQLDRTSYANTLKDAREALQTYQTNVEMKVLDTTVVLTDLRDDIKNQRYVVEEATITLAQSKYEPPATIRQAEIPSTKHKEPFSRKLKVMICR